MTHRTPDLLRGGALLALMPLALGVAACDATEKASAPELATIAAPLEASTTTFPIRGALAAATCDAQGNPVWRNANSVSMQMRTIPAATCASFTGQAFTDCVALVSPLTAEIGVVANTSAAGDETFTSEPKQFIVDGTTNIPIHWRPSYSSTTTEQGVTTASGPLVYFQSGTRYLFYGLPVGQWDVVAPTTAGAQANVDIVSQNLASYRLRLEYTPTIRNGATLSDLDRITAVQAWVYLDDNAGSPTRRILSRFLYACTNGVCTNDASNVDPATAAGVNRFLNIPAVDGAPVTPQIVIAEMPIMYNTTGDYAGLNYRMNLTVTFADGVTSTLTNLSVGPTSVAPCEYVDRTLQITRPPSEINGSIVLRRDTSYADSPVVTHYSPTVKNTVNGAYGPVNISGNPTFTPVTAPATPTSPDNSLAFRWLGFPASDYRLEAPSNSTSYSSWLFGHALLSYPSRPAFTYASSRYPALFRFPMNGSSTPDGTFALTEADANADGQADNPVTLTIADDMAYLQGSVTLAGCVTPANYTQGIAEYQGTGAAQGGSDVTRGFARGLFAAGSPNYLVAAIGGTWQDKRYAFRFDAAYDQHLFIEPANPAGVTLTEGWSNVSTAPARAYKTSQVSITMSVKDANGNFVPSRNPVLEINGEINSELGEFRDPTTNTLLGKYYARSARADNTAANEHTLTVVGMASSTPVSVKPSVEVLSAGRWVRTDILVPQLINMATTGDGCADVCIVPGTNESYTDDAIGPTLSGVTQSQTLSWDATSATLSGTLSDQVPITHVIVNGTEYPVTSTSDGQATPTFTATFSLNVNVSAGTNTFTVAGKGACGRLTATGSTATVTFDVPVGCSDPMFDQCVDANPGSVFWVDVVSPQGQPCQLRCAIDGVGGQLTCDSTPTCN